MKDSKLLPVLMTASVDTRGMPSGAFAATDREKMYVESIRLFGGLLKTRLPISLDNAA